MLNRPHQGMSPDFDAGDLAQGAGEVAQHFVPSKILRYLLLLPALAGAGICEVVSSVATKGLPKWDEAGFALGVLLLNILWVIPPLVVRRRALAQWQPGQQRSSVQATFLSFSFGAGMLLWIAAYLIGIAFVLCYPLIYPYL